ncbi:MAG: FtsX-like permease family protein [Armatimonadota bacterium]|nr:FtsX-like permease family protein [bacterium]
MSKATVNNPTIGRQTQLPFRRAFQIALDSMKARFGRSIVTASGIFLGIAFLTTVLTQSLLQWPLPEKIAPGTFMLDGQVNGLGEFSAWKSISVDEGIKAGISRTVIERVSSGSKTFSLTAIAQGIADAKRADRNLARVKSESRSLKKVDKKLYEVTTGDRDLSLGEAKKAGVPWGMIKHIAGDASTIKQSALAAEIAKQPYWVSLWTSRAKRYAIFKTVPSSAITTLDKRYALTLADALKQARGPSKDADMKSVMIVNHNGRRILADFTKDNTNAGSIRLADGDNVLVPDRNVRYRTYWLVIMSLLVCSVGITNSMLMSVTERFKEIGTMKCLGALDKFVVLLFMLESGMMGIVASIFGWLIGFVLMVVMAGFSRGWAVLATLSPADVFKMFFEAVGIGLFITIVATIAPALRAANMPAAIALRAEI